MTLSDLNDLAKYSVTDTKRRAVSLRQLSFLFYYSRFTNTVLKLGRGRGPTNGKIVLQRRTAPADILSPA